MSGLSEGKFLSDARRMSEVLGPMSAKLPKDLTDKAIKATVDALDKALAEVKRLTVERQAAINAKDVALKLAQDLVVRARGAVKAVYGPDSTEYEQVGGTRKSERKKPARKPAAVA